MSKHKFNPFTFNFDDLGKTVDDFLSNVKVDDFFGSDCLRSLPAINAIEHPDKIVLSVAAPGLKKEDFDLHLENDLLTISSDRKKEDLPDDVKIRRREYDYSKFKRTFKLSQKYDYTNIKAKYENGLLIVTVAKKDGQNDGKIKVEVS
jgi:HSP20 family protein